MSAGADQRFMALALSLGRQGLGRTWPNPSVGCVIVNAGRIVGRGRTADGGRPHAETQALAMAGPLARDATAYVTLEPCAHTGQTPPCAAALVASGVARVVVALGDPDARVAGRGIAILRDAGIEVTQGLCLDQACEDLAGYLWRNAHGRPSVTLKLATTLDGRIATAAGESRWITGRQARAQVHGMRARHDAVMIGGGTARADDPMLDVRGWGDVPQPVRVVVSAGLDLPTDGRLARTAGEIPLWLCHAGASESRVAAWRALGAEAIDCAAHGTRVSLEAVLGALGTRGLTRVMCEGGGALAASLLARDLVDEIVAFTAGFALGADATPAVAGLGGLKLREAQRYRIVEARRIGDDAMTRWVRDQGAG